MTGVIARRFLGAPAWCSTPPPHSARSWSTTTQASSGTRATIRTLRHPSATACSSAEAKPWRHQRPHPGPAFTPKATTLLAPLYHRRDNEAIADAHRRSDGVNLLAAGSNLTLENRRPLMFSLEMRGHGPSCATSSRIIRTASPPSSARFPDAIELSTAGQDFGRRRFGKVWMPLIEQIVAERNRVAPRRAAHLFESPDAGADPRERRRLLGGAAAEPRSRTMITAGHETTARFVRALYLLAMAPAIPEPRRRRVSGIALDESRSALGLYPRRHRRGDGGSIPPAFAIVRAAPRRDVPRHSGPAAADDHRAVGAPTGIIGCAEPRRLRPEPRFPPGAAADRPLSPICPSGRPAVCIGAHFAATDATSGSSPPSSRRFRIEKEGPGPVLPLAVGHPTQAPTTARISAVST